MFCKRCGQYMPDGSTICQACGNVLQPAEPAKKKINIWYILIPVIAVVSIGIVILSLILILSLTGVFGEKKTLSGSRQIDTIDGGKFDDDDGDDDKFFFGGSSGNTLEDYFNTQEMQKQLQQAKDSVKDSGLSVDVEVSGNTITYIYQYDSITYSDELRDSLEKAMEGQEATLEAMADGIRKQVKIDSITMVYEYRDCDGKLIYSKEFITR